MSRDELRQRINRRLEQERVKYRRVDAEVTGRRRQAPRPGDLYVLTETAEIPIQWLVVERDVADAEGYLVIPADSHPMVGSADVAVPPEAPSGALSLRCAFEVWVRARDLDPEMRTGFVDDDLLEKARRKRAEIQSGNLLGSSRQRGTDVEPEYQDWAQDVLAKAQDIASELSDGAPEPSAGGVELRLRVGGGDADAEDLDQLTLQLMSEIGELAIANVARIGGGEVPLGARSAGAVEIGAITVRMRGEGLAKLLEVLQDWAVRERRRTIEIEAVDGREIEPESLGSKSGGDLRDVLKRLAALRKRD